MSAVITHRSTALHNKSGIFSTSPTYRFEQKDVNFNNYFSGNKHPHASNTRNYNSTKTV